MTQNENKKTDEKKAPALIAYHVPDREKAPWTRIGAAWDHKDGKGFTLSLDLVPTTRTARALRLASIWSRPPEAASSCGPLKKSRKKGRARERSFHALILPPRMKRTGNRLLSRKDRPWPNMLW